MSKIHWRWKYDGMEYQTHTLAGEFSLFEYKRFFRALQTSQWNSVEEARDDIDFWYEDDLELEN